MLEFVTLTSDNETSALEFMNPFKIIFSGLFIHIWPLFLLLYIDFFLMGYYKIPELHVVVTDNRQEVEVWRCLLQECLALAHPDTLVPKLTSSIPPLQSKNNESALHQ